LFDGPIGDALAGALVRGGKYQVVQRRRLDESFKQLHQRDSRGIIGADYFLTGSAQSLMGQIRINARLIETETTKVVAAEGISGNPADAIKLAEQLAARF
jgi:TolB-like protein